MLDFICVERYLDNNSIDFLMKEKNSFSYKFSKTINIILNNLILKNNQLIT